MSILNRVNYSLNDVENVQHKLQPAKQYGASSSGLGVKKKALADVGNTLHQNSVQRNTKTGDAVSKPFAKEKSFSKVSNNNKIKGNNFTMLKREKTTPFMLNKTFDNVTCDKEIVEPPCQYCDIKEDDYADILFKNIQLSKPQIEDLALNWENPILYSTEDKREILVSDSLLQSVSNTDFFSFYLESKLSSDIDEDIIEVLNTIEVPPVLMDDIEE